MVSMRIQRGIYYDIPEDYRMFYNPSDMVLVQRESTVNYRMGEWIGSLEVGGMDASSQIVYISEDINYSARIFNFVKVKPYHEPEIFESSSISDIKQLLQYHCSAPDEDEIFMTKFIANGDPKSNCEEMIEAKRKENIDILIQGTFTPVLIADVPKDATIIHGKFVLAIKYKIDGKIKYKARNVVGGHRDELK